MRYHFILAPVVCVTYLAVPHNINTLHIRRMLSSLFFTSSSSSSSKPPQQQETTIKGVTYAQDGTVTSCIFCNIIKRTEPATIVAETDDMIVFRTIAPATTNHLLVCPKIHTKNAASLVSVNDADLVERMRKLGNDTIDALLPEQPSVSKRFCFHMPPFNSIDHLHLHCIAQPETMTWLGHVKYFDQSFYCHSSERIINSLNKLPKKSSAEKK
jgi:diadenosine tetraphosphate (Ap4A) HIT family hydrolase